MKRFSVISLIFSLLFIFSCEDKKDTTPITFIKTYGGKENDFGYSVKQTTDGGYILTGSTNSFGNGNYDVYLIKTNSQGTEEWNKTLGGSNQEGGYSVQQTTDGGYIVTGNTYSYGNGEYDVWLIKTDSQGIIEWNKTFGGSEYDDGRSVQQTTDGGYIITGKTDSFGNGGYDVYLIKTNSNGNEEWNKTFGGSNWDVGNSVQQTSDGGYIIIGSTKSSNGSVYNDVWLIKTDSNGNEEWNQTFGGSQNEYGSSVQQTTDGGYIITGSTVYTENFDGDVLLIKTNSEGIEEWNKTFGGSNTDFGNSVQQTVDGGYIISGYTIVDYNPRWGNSNVDVYLIKTNSNGNEEWNKTFGGNKSDRGHSVQQTTDGGYIITGSTSSFGSFTHDSDIWLIKTDSEGNTVDYK